jgi:hypothetical protein
MPPVRRVSNADRRVHYIESDAPFHFASHPIELRPCFSLRKLWSAAEIPHLRKICRFTMPGATENLPTWRFGGNIDTLNGYVRSDGL